MTEAQKSAKQRSAGLSVLHSARWEQSPRSVSLALTLTLSRFPSYDSNRSKTDSLITAGQCAPLRKHSWRRPPVGQSRSRHSTHPRRRDNHLALSRLLVPTIERQRSSLNARSFPRWAGPSAFQKKPAPPAQVRAPCCKEEKWIALVVWCSQYIIFCQSNKSWFVLQTGWSVSEARVAPARCLHWSVFLRCSVSLRRPPCLHRQQWRRQPLWITFRVRMPK